MVTVTTDTDPSDGFLCPRGDSKGIMFCPCLYVCPSSVRPLRFQIWYIQLPSEFSSNRFDTMHNYFSIIKMGLWIVVDRKKNIF